jgi:NIF3 (NGG1p interacting factor 3)
MQTAPIKDLIGFLNALLNPSAFDDYGPNGLQVPGKDQVGTLVTGVSASTALFQRAVEERADLVLVHHGLFWGAMRAIDASALASMGLARRASRARARGHRRPRAAGAPRGVRHGVHASR